MNNVLTNKVDPYKTSIGELINTSKLKEKINRYLIDNDTNLSYEYGYNNTNNLVFITGKNSDEEALPLWEHPLIMEDVRNDYIIAIDLRKYVKNVPNGANILEPYIRDNAGYTFSILRTLLTNEFLNGEYNILRSIQKNLVSSFSTWLSTLIANSINLDPVEKVNTEIAIQYYMYLMLVNGDIDIGAIAIATNKISTAKLSLPVNKKTISNLISSFDPNIVDMYSLVNNIKIAIGNVKADYINVDVLINLVNSSWFGPGGSETPIMALENIPTWYSMVYVSVSNKSYKKSRLAMILDKQRNKLNLKTISDTIALYIKEQKI